MTIFLKYKLSWAVSCPSVFGFLTKSFSLPTSKTIKYRKLLIVPLEVFLYVGTKLSYWLVCLDCYCLYPVILEAKTLPLCISLVQESTLLVHSVIMMYCCACHSSLGRCNSHLAVVLHPTKRSLLQYLSSKSYNMLFEPENSLDLKFSSVWTHNTSSDVPKVLLLNVEVFCDVMLCCWANSSQHFKTSWHLQLHLLCLHLLILMMKALWSFKMLGTTYPATQCNIPEHLNLWEHSTSHCPKTQYCNSDDNACWQSLWFEDANC